MMATIEDDVVRQVQQDLVVGSSERFAAVGGNSKSRQEYGLGANHSVYAECYDNEGNAAATFRLTITAERIS